MSTNPKFKVSDRVKRAKMPGCHGTVKDVKTEITAATNEARERGVMFTVMWDNGTFSYMGPEGLEAAPQK